MSVGGLVIVIIVTALFTAVLLIKAGTSVISKIIELFGCGKVNNKNGCALPIIIFIIVCVFIVSMCS